MISEKDRRDIVRKASEKYKLPVGYINTLVKKGVVSLPLSHIDELILDAYSRTWRSITLLKISISNIPKAKRKELFEPMSRLEQYIFSYLCEFYKQGKIVSTSQVIFQLRSNKFKIPSKGKRLDEIKKLIARLRRRCKRLLPLSE